MIFAAMVATALAQVDPLPTLIAAVREQMHLL
jgi:hypothetical protein